VVISVCARHPTSTSTGWHRRAPELAPQPGPLRCETGGGPLYTGRAYPAQFKVRAMKEGIHPDYHEITIVMTDGSTYQTRSTYGKAGDTLRLEIDPKSHPAWTGGQQRLLDTGGQLARFNRRFQGFGVKQ
jgi:large subunit ribosomal protein L31